MSSFSKKITKSLKKAANPLTHFKRLKRNKLLPWQLHKWAKHHWNNKDKVMYNIGKNTTIRHGGGSSSGTTTNSASVVPSRISSLMGGV